MRMGNLLSVEGLSWDVMSQAQPRLGVHHTTVVPTNFESAPESEREPEEADGESAHGSNTD